MCTRFFTVLGSGTARMSTHRAMGSGYAKLAGSMLI